MVSVVSFELRDTRGKMQENSPQLIRHRRPFLRGYPDVFVGFEAVAWAMKNLSLNGNNNGDESIDTEEDNLKTSESEGSTSGTDSVVAKTDMTGAQAVSLFQKLMDAGLLRNVQTMEGFKNDKSLYRFSADDVDGDKLVTSVAIGYRLYKSAASAPPDDALFQKVCALGQLLSSECLRATDVVGWMCARGLSPNRDAATAIAQHMLDTTVIRSVHRDVKRFDDDATFYRFTVDYGREPLTVQQFLYNNIDYFQPKPQQDKPNPAPKPQPSYLSLLSDDGSMTKEALLHPAAPFVKKDLRVYPDPVGYGFVIRGKGPCFVKIVDPDSPAGKVGIKALQYITVINGENVLDKSHTSIEDMILSGPKRLEISVMQQVERSSERTAEPADASVPTPPATPAKIRYSSPLPSAQPWMLKKTASPYHQIRDNLSHPGHVR